MCSKENVKAVFLRIGVMLFLSLGAQTSNAQLITAGIMDPEIVVNTAMAAANTSVTAANTLATNEQLANVSVLLTTLQAQLIDLNATVKDVAVNTSTIMVDENFQMARSQSKDTTMTVKNAAFMAVVGAMALP